MLSGTAHSTQRLRFDGSLADIVRSTNLLTYLLTYIYGYIQLVLGLTAQCVYG